MHLSSEQLERIKSGKCYVCAGPLSDRDLTEGLHVHVNCANCHFCGQAMPNSSQIASCWKEGRPASHSGCFERALDADFKNNEIVLTREHIERLNKKILHVYDGIKDSTVNDIEALSALLRDLTECAANVSYALARVKDKIAIRTASDYREKIQYEKQEKSKKQVEKAIDEQARQAEKADPRLKARRLAIEGFMKIPGITKEMAEKMVDSQSGAKQ